MKHVKSVDKLTIWFSYRKNFDTKNLHKHMKTKHSTVKIDTYTSEGSMSTINFYDNNGWSTSFNQIVNETKSTNIKQYFGFFNK